MINTVGMVLHEPGRDDLDVTVGIRLDAEGDIHFYNSGVADEVDICVSTDMWDAMVNAVIELLELAAKGEPVEDPEA